MALLEKVAGDGATHVDFVNPAGPEQLATLSPVTVTGAHYVGARAHEIPGRAVGCHVVKPHPKIQVATGATDEDFRVDRASDFGVGGQWLTVEGEQVFAQSQLPIIVGAQIVVLVRYRVAGIRDEGAGAMALQTARKHPRFSRPGLPQIEASANRSRRPVAGFAPGVGAHYVIANRAAAAHAVGLAAQAVVHPIEDHTVVVDLRVVGEMPFACHCAARLLHTVDPRPQQ